MQGSAVVSDVGMRSLIMNCRKLKCVKMVGMSNVSIGACMVSELGVSCWSLFYRAILLRHANLRWADFRVSVTLTF